MAIKALIFDFDGLIVDTETPAFLSWGEIYEEHRQALAPSYWAPTIGTIGAFDPLSHLEELLGEEVDRVDLRKRRRRREEQLVEDEPVAPGVLDYIRQAQDAGLRLAVASSSPRQWVEDHLNRLGLASYFDALQCADGDPARAKPSPALYTALLKDLEVDATECIALEDSPNGIAAAKAAGLFCVCVPNALTFELDLSQADLVLDSLEDLSLEELVEQATAADSH